MEKEYVSLWLSKESAEEIKKLQSCDNEKHMVEEVAKKLSLNIERELTQLDDDLARYKAACIVFKNSLTDVYHEQQEEIDKVIDTVWDVMPKVKQETTKLVNTLQEDLEPLNKQLKETEIRIENLKSQFNGINFYAAERMTELVDKISNLDEDSKEILKFLTSEYKKEK
ncbi:hypothetical protein AXI64_gp214 [Vibrio phage qdvp001]|uniref:hypothetical protein n=1 Tax=Vibrio phage qdvp001 TaxID=1003177 RepID=UPI0007224DDD|nr:hypothetical protein AXI64_gp001 [Vibrio phage qdvp001]YP_009222225.1 hypothetical protein AXI64_gp214 [Vibrio phage qdvp001]ALM61993.1 hypothetical protein qdvp001_001 [Vibrio phage qdvp001]ALM62206.1 hypothetical protein qdvp001_214 [Vibrio phage qdvp001]